MVFRMILSIFLITFSIFTAVVPIIYCVVNILKDRSAITYNYLSKSLIFLFLWSIFVSIINKSMLSFLASFLFLGYFSVSVYIERNMYSMKIVNKMCEVTVYCTLLTVINGFVEKIIFIFIGNSSHRIFSSYGNPNMAGAWFASIIFVVLYLKKLDKNKKKKLLYDVFIFLLILSLLLTESSGAIVSFIIAIIIYVILENIKSNRSMRNFFLIGFIGVCFTIVLSNICFDEIIQEFIISFNSRIHIWKGSINMFITKPVFGFGVLGTIENGKEFLNINGGTIHSHNLWLTFSVTLGLVGLCGYLLLKLKLYKDIVMSIKNKSNIASLVAAINILVVIQGFVDVSLYSPQIALLFIAVNSIIVNKLK